MTEGIRKIKKVSVLMNCFHVTAILYVVSLLISVFLRDNNSIFFEIETDFGPSLFGAMAFQFIFLSVGAFMLKLESAGSKDLLVKISILNLIFISLIELIQVLAFKVANDYCDIISSLLGILISIMVVFVVEKMKIVK